MKEPMRISTRLPLPASICEHGCKHMVELHIGANLFQMCEVDAFHLGRGLMDTVTARDNVKISLGGK